MKTVEKLSVAQRAIRRRMLKHEEGKAMMNSHSSIPISIKNNKKERGSPIKNMESVWNYFGLIIDFLRFCNLLKLFINYFQLALLLLLFFLYYFETCLLHLH